MHWQSGKVWYRVPPVALVRNPFNLQSCAQMGLVGRVSREAMLQDLGESQAPSPGGFRQSWGG